MFERNIHTYTIKEQLKLYQSTVCILGVGGGGCAVAEILARTGIGNLILVDGDRFESSNKNRQIGATDKSIGKYKVDIMAERICDINPNCKMTTYNCFVTSDNATTILSGGVDVVCDTVDGLNNKMLVNELCIKHNKTEVTGGLGGYYYWASVLKDKSIDSIFKDEKGKICNPCCSSVFAQAALQAQLIINEILGRNDNIKDKIIECNLLNYGMSVIDIE